MTLRAHLEANDQLLGFALNAADVAAPLTIAEAIKQARKHAVAALRILDEAPRLSQWDGVRLIPDRSDLAEYDEEERIRGDQIHRGETPDA